MMNTDHILSGQYLKDTAKNNLWQKLNKIVIEENPEDSKKELQVKAIWIKAYSGNAPFVESYDKLPPFSFKRHTEEDPIFNAYFWTIEDINEFYKKNPNNDAYTIIQECFNRYYTVLLC